MSERYIPKEGFDAGITKLTSLYHLQGLGALVSALPALCYDVQILMAVAARRAASAAKLQALAVAVEQQTRLIAAGDKPTVTPGTLSDWVSGLLATRDKAFVNTAERCRLALRGRGYELPVKVGGKGTGQVKKREPADEGGGGKGAEGTPVVTEGTGGSGAVPSSRAGNLFRAATNSGEVDGGEGSLDAAEKGTKRPPKRQQVTPEDTPKTPVWVPVSLDSLRDA